MERTKHPKKQSLKLQTMSSNLPLLFANSRPTTLDRMTEAQLEKFVSFMTQCSFIQKDSAWRKDVIMASKPKWWPHQIPFKIPLDSGYPSGFVSRKAMLKTLVCCCYTFYNCEFLLKFSSELAEMEPESLCYVPNGNGNITLIYTIQGALLVKCRNENLTYDRGLADDDISCSDGYHNREFTSKSVCVIDDDVHCIDITDSVSEDDNEQDDEVHFKQGSGTVKRKLNSNYKTLNHKRLYCSPRKEPHKEHIEVIDLTEDSPPVEEQTQAVFMKVFGLLPTREIREHVTNCELSKKLVKAARRSCLLPFSSKCGQEVYISNKQSINAYHVDRVNRYCSTTDLPKTQHVPQVESSDEEEDRCSKWTHTYKPGRRCQNPQRLHRGPSLKHCVVKLTRLSDEEITRFKNKSKFTQKTGEEQFFKHEVTKFACPQLRMTYDSGLETAQCHVKADNLPVTTCTVSNNKLPVVQITKITITADHKNRESVSPVRKHVGLSDSEISKVIVPGNDDALPYVEEYPNTRSENKNKSTLELKRSFPSNYLKNTIKKKITKLLTNLNYEPVCSSLKYLPRKLSLSKCLDSAIEWYAQRNNSGLKGANCFNSKQLQENLVPDKDVSLIQNRKSMCGLIGRANGKDMLCYCCSQGLYKLCVYDYIYKAKQVRVLEQKNYEQLKAYFIRMYFKIFSEVKKKNNKLSKINLLLQ